MAIVPQQQAQPVVIPTQMQAHTSCTRMPRHVGQRLLHHAIEVHLGVHWQRWNRSSQPDFALDALGALPLLGELPDGVFQVQVIEHHRIQVTHQRAKAVLQIKTVLLEVRRGFANGVRLLRLHAQQADPRPDARQILAEIVMQRLRQAAAM